MVARALEDVLSASVRDHLVADVPVGVLLSGGVDSSTVAALATRHAGRVKTFTVVHDDPAYDEREAARAVADAIGSEHYEIKLPETGLSEEELDTLVDHHGVPFADSSSLAVLRLAREVRQHVTVALSGDGGDEVFAGYPRFGLLRVMSALARFPRPALRIGSAMFGLVPGAADTTSGAHAARSSHAARWADGGLHDALLAGRAGAPSAPRVGVGGRFHPRSMRSSSNAVPSSSPIL